MVRFVVGNRSSMATTRREGPGTMIVLVVALVLLVLALALFGDVQPR